MDHYYTNDQFMVVLNNEEFLEKLEPSTITSSNFTTIFSKPIQMKQKMECSVVTAVVPELYRICESKEFEITVHYHILQLPEQPSHYKDLKAYRDTYFNVFSKEFMKLPLKIDNFNELKIRDEFEQFDKNVESLLWEKLFSKYPELRNPEPDPFPEYNTEMLWFFDSLFLERDYNIDRLYLENRPTSLLLRYGSDKYLMMIAYYELSEELYEFLGIPEEMKPLNNLIWNNEMFTPLEIYSKFLKRKSSVPVKISIPVESHNGLSLIHCDIIRESYMCGNKESILNIIPFNSQSTIKEIEYKNLIYISLTSDEIHSININLKDCEGNILGYKKGSITIVLKFRPVEHI